MKISRLFICWFVGFAILAGAGTAKADDQIKNMLVILTSPAVETQAMALVLANYSAKNGTKVHLLLCDVAGDIALKDQPEQAKKVVTPSGMTVSSLLGALRKKGGTIDVCAIYLPNRKLKADVLQENTGVATPPAIAKEMTAIDTRLAIF